MMDWVPKDMPEFARPAWGAALMAAARDDHAVAAFMRDTGCKYQPPRSPIEQMIDDAAGVIDPIGLAFILWFNENVWGQWKD